MLLGAIATSLEAKGLTHLAADVDAVATSVEAASHASLADAVLFGSFTDPASGKVVSVNRWSATGDFRKDPSAPQGKSPFVLVATDRKGAAQEVPMWLFTGHAQKKSGETTEFDGGKNLTTPAAPTPWKDKPKDPVHKGVKFYGASYSGTEYRNSGKPRAWLDAVATGVKSRGQDGRELLEVLDPVLGEMRKLDISRFTGTVTGTDGAKHEVENGPTRTEMLEAVRESEELLG